VREYSESAWERAMKVQEVALRAMAKRISWVAGGRDLRRNPADYMRSGDGQRHQAYT
jgi:hypothetical protein